MHTRKVFFYADADFAPPCNQNDLTILPCMLNVHKNLTDELDLDEVGRDLKYLLGKIVWSTSDSSKFSDKIIYIYLRYLVIDYLHYFCLPFSLFEKFMELKQSCILWILKGINYCLRLIFFEFVFAMYKRRRRKLKFIFVIYVWYFIAND